MSALIRLRFGLVTANGHTQVSNRCLDGIVDRDTTSARFIAAQYGRGAVFVDNVEADA